VKQSGGYVWVYSELENGTSFKVYLPVACNHRTAEERSAEIEESEGGTERVLLVEDEEQLRTLAKVVLEEKGYVVAEARNGKAAIELCENPLFTVDIMITDVVMPKMSGRELAEIIKTLRPHTRFCSYRDIRTIQW
jgi:response regulator RpfG family c-di-GMP phosphodiesterase